MAALCASPGSFSHGNLGTLSVTVIARLTLVLTGIIRCATTPAICERAPKRKITRIGRAKVEVLGEILMAPILTQSASPVHTGITTGYASILNAGRGGTATEAVC